MSGTRESVVRMANQIASNFAVQGSDVAVCATAEHIRLFWDPRMKSAAFGLLAERDVAFSPEARAALERLAAEAGCSAA